LSKIFFLFLVIAFIQLSKSVRFISIIVIVVFVTIFIIFIVVFITVTIAAA
jgi:hypothetical protein